MKFQKHSSVVVTGKVSFKGMEKLLPVLTFFSGVAALVYESLWMRSFGLIFGNTTHAITVILATYMGGIALGSYLVGKVRVKNPLKTYALIELLIAISAIIAFFLLKLMPGLWGNFLRNIPLPIFLEVLTKILFAGIIILIPTLAMGATVPMLVQILSRKVSHHKVLSRLYYMNTFGGATGVLLATFFLFPVLGLSKTYSIAVALNLLIAGISLLILFYKKLPITDSLIIEAENKSTKVKVSTTFILVASVVGATSFCLEILWSRSFALVIGSSIYSFNLMLFSFLLGLVIGTVLYEKYWEKIKNPGKLLTRMLLVLGIGIILSANAIGWSPLFYYSLMDFLPLSFGVYQLVGFLMCFFIMVLLTSIFGFIFPLLLRLVSKDTYNPANSRLITSKLYAWNTLGTLIGALLTGFVIIPIYGLQNGYVIAATMPLILGFILQGINKKWTLPTRIVSVSAIVVITVALSLLWKPWNPLVVTSGLYKYGLQQVKGTRSNGATLLKSFKGNRKIVYYSEGIEGVVSVTNSDDMGLYLSVNGKIDASIGDQVTQKMLAHVPMAHNPNSKNALVIGWGSGCTSGTAGLYPLQSIETIEIEPAVYKTRTLFSGINSEIYNDKRFHIIFKDGRNVLLTTPKLYDVITSEPSNPWITGVSNLFTQEFYQSGLSRLNKQGVFCQWFHIYDMPLEVLQSQVQTFCSVFPDAMLWIVPPEHLRLNESSFLNGDLLMIGSREPISIDLKRVKQLFEAPAIKADLASCGIDNIESFVSNAILDRKGLLRLCEKAPINTDDYPFIEFNAPRGLFHNETELRKQIYIIYDAIQKADTSILPGIINDQVVASSRNKEELSEIYKNFGDLYAQKSMLFLAERAYKGAVRLNQNAAPMLEFYIKWQQYERAISWYEKEQSHFKNDFHTLELIRLAYSKTGKTQKAKEVENTMLREFPKEVNGNFSGNKLSKGK
jgi:spermidine synthase